MLRQLSRGFDLCCLHAVEWNCKLKRACVHVKRLKNKFSSKQDTVPIFPFYKIYVCVSISTLIKMSVQWHFFHLFTFSSPYLLIYEQHQCKKWANDPRVWKALTSSRCLSICQTATAKLVSHTGGIACAHTYTPMHSGPVDRLNPAIECSKQW